MLADALEAKATGRLQRARDLCESALKLDPRNIDALCAYASLALQVARPDVALELGRRAVALDSDRADACHWLGAAERQCGQFQNAIAHLGRAFDLQPDRLDSLVELSLAFIDAGDAPAAEQFLDKALGTDANSAAVQAALGRFYESTGRPDDAIAAYRRAIALDAQQPEAHISLGNALRNAGDLDGAIATHGRAIALAPNRPDTWSNLLLTLQCSDGISAREIAEKHREFGRYFSKLLLPLPPSPRAPLAGRRLKIGYLSSHFRRHAVAKFFQALIRAHDVRMFEIHCYYSGAASDDITEEIRGQVEHFAPVHGMRDGYVAAQIRRDGIDILVDVDGHTAFNRLAVFFLKPAPVQVTWLGYLATTGVPAIDFRLTDARADPPGLADELHTETLWRLPSTAWCYQPYAEAPPVASPPVAANGFPTLVSLNDPAKVTPSVLELWARIMREVPRSRLILHTSRQPSRIFELEAFFAARGVAASRVDLVERRSIGEYFVLYNRADIALDTWPCAGGTTTCDALWMGVPVVTLTGEASYSRTGASLLASLGMDEFVNATGDAYVATAVALARDPPRLAQLRAQLRPRMLASCLTDGVAFAREVEAAFVGMWEHRSMSSGPRRAGSS